jgi:hypothetical protein
MSTANRGELLVVKAFIDFASANPTSFMAIAALASAMTAVIIIPIFDVSQCSQADTSKSDFGEQTGLDKRS